MPSEISRIYVVFKGVFS